MAGASGIQHVPKILAGSGALIASTCIMKSQKAQPESEYERACDTALLPDMDWHTWKTATVEEMGDMRRHPPHSREIEYWRQSVELNDFKSFDDLPDEAIELLE